MLTTPTPPSGYLIYRSRCPPCSPPTHFLFGMRRRRGGGWRGDGPRGPRNGRFDGNEDGTGGSRDNRLEKPNKFPPRPSNPPPKKKDPFGDAWGEVDPSAAANTLNEKDKYGNLIKRKSTDRGDNMAKVTTRLKGKVALCVACSVGLGYAVARRLAQEGARVIIVSRKQAKVDTAVQQLKHEGLLASGFPCDVDREEERRALLNYVKREFRRVDCLFLNQGTTDGGGTLLDASVEQFNGVFQTNVKSRWLQIKEFLPIMPRGSSIVITNGAGAYSPDSSAGVFYVTEAALLGMTVLLAKELGGAGIRVNAVAPGPVRTRFATDLWVNRDGVNNEEKTAGSVWLGRIGEPDDVAGCVAFMMSDDAAWFTGQTMVVDGGSHSRL